MSPAPSHVAERPPAFIFRQTSRRKELFCEQVRVRELAMRFGTPLYIYSATTIKTRLAAIDRAFGDFPHTICYSVKANSSLGVLRLFARPGAGFDVVSGGELARVRKVDRKAVKRVVFSGVGKTEHEIAAGLKAGILLFNVESEAELDLLADSANRLRRRAPVALRVNPDVSAKTHPYISTGLHQHKFGIPIAQARDLYQRAARLRSLDLCGVSVHIGSQINEVSPFAAAMEKVADLIRILRADGHNIRYADAGGGFGIDYQPASPTNFDEQITSYAAAVVVPLRGLDVHLLLEPGRAIVGPAGTLLTQVLYRKNNNGKQFVVVDGAMNDLMRPSLYQAHHQIIPVCEASEEEQCETVDVVGPICETGDFFARNRQLAPVKQGDLLAILDTGAYGMALSSNYNTRPRAAEVMVEGKVARLIRRRETIADLLRTER